MEKITSRPRIACLDGIRALAALMVMTFHFIGNHDPSPGILQAAAVGQTGVDLFFVLSGFLITRILLASKESPHYFRAFYARRVLRIFPLYYGFLVVFYFVLPLIGAERSTFGTQWWTWLFLQNIPATFPSLASYGPYQFWSLAVEEHFYLAWPLLVREFSRRHFACVVLATLVGPLVLRFVFIHQGIEFAYFTLTRLDAIGCGGLLALWLSRERVVGSRALWLLRGSLVVLPALLLPTFVIPSDQQPDWMMAWKFSLLPAFYGVLIAFCLVDPVASPLSAFFSLPWLRWLGAISYGLYVFHPTCFALIETFAKPTNLAGDAAMSFGLTILVAFLSFRFFETPILRLKRHFPYESPGTGAPPWQTD